MNARDKCFVQEYLIDLDAKNAALRAGFSPATAKNAYKWLGDGDGAKPAVIKAVEKAKADRAARTEVNADDVVRELAKIAFANITNIVNTEDLTICPSAGRNDTAAIASMKVKEGRVCEREVRLHDKVHALELLGRHIGMFDDKLELKGASPVVIFGGELLED